MQLLQGVNALHQRGICHRDLKITNLLVNRHGQLKLIDYGFSTYFLDEKLSSKEKKIRRKLSLYCGTPSYMAPEMVILRLRKKMNTRNNPDEEFSQETSHIFDIHKERIESCPHYYYGDKVDIWAVGVVIYKILTGNYAFGGKRFSKCEGLLTMKLSRTHS